MLLLLLLCYSKSMKHLSWKAGRDFLPCWRWAVFLNEAFWFFAFSSVDCDPKEACEHELGCVHRTIEGEQAPEREEWLQHDLLTKRKFSLWGANQHPTGQAEQRTCESPALRPPAGTTGSFLSSLLVSYTSMKLTEQLAPHAKDSSVFCWEGTLVSSGGKSIVKPCVLLYYIAVFSPPGPFFGVLNSSHSSQEQEEEKAYLFGHETTTVHSGEMLGLSLWKPGLNIAIDLCIKIQFQFTYLDLFFIMLYARTKLWVCSSKVWLGYVQYVQYDPK